MKRIDVVIILVLLGGLCLLYLGKQKADRRAAIYHSAKNQCLEAGYPKMNMEGPFDEERYICVRQVNGSDQMLEVKP